MTLILVRLESLSVKNLYTEITIGVEITNNNRRTNGPVWSERLAEAWGLQLQSYAALGSRTCRASDVASPSIASQVERFRNTVAHGDQRQSTSDVHAFFIGITDITNSTSKGMTLIYLSATSSPFYCICIRIRSKQPCRMHQPTNCK